MFENVFGHDFHGQAGAIPHGHDWWHEGGLPSGHGHHLSGHAHQADHSGVGHGSGTSSQGHGSTPSSSSSAADQTLVGSPGGLQIDLLWDPSVAHAPSDFKAAVTEAATYLTKVFSTDEVINLHVGWGEVGGSSLAANALGASESVGYLSDYATVAGAVHAPAAGNAPTSGQFFVTSAEAKALGLASPASSAVDGYIGIGTLSGTGYSWHDSTSASPIGANQFDLQAVLQHEMTEVMGRIGMEGQVVNGQPTYTPLDLFNFNGPSTLELSANGGYFSTDGQTNLGTYNNASANGGDIADWAPATSPAPSGSQSPAASGASYDAYDAFAVPGATGQVTSSDITEMAALGYAVRIA